MIYFIFWRWKSRWGVFLRNRPLEWDSDCFPVGSRIFYLIVWPLPIMWWRYHKTSETTADYFGEWVDLTEKGN